MYYKPLSEFISRMRQAYEEATLVFWICGDPMPKSRSILVLLFLIGLAIQNHILWQQYFIISRIQNSEDIVFG